MTTVSDWLDTPHAIRHVTEEHGEMTVRVLQYARPETSDLQDTDIEILTDSHRMLLASGLLRRRGAGTHSKHKLQVTERGRKAKKGLL